MIRPVFKQRAVSAAAPRFTKSKRAEAQEEKARDTKRVLTDVQKAWNEQAKREQKIFMDEGDSEFWFAVCFCTRDDKEAFLKHFDLLRGGDKYLSGYDFAERFGLKLKRPAAPRKVAFQPKKRWLGLAQKP